MEGLMAQVRVGAVEEGIAEGTTLSPKRRVTVMIITELLKDRRLVADRMLMLMLTFTAAGVDDV